MGFVGAGLYLAGQETVGTTLALAGTASMTAAGLVLLTSSPDKARASLIQMVPAALAVVFLILGAVA
jgi:putative membrane protein